jgi:predicted HTH domain antitoxin
MSLTLKISDSVCSAMRLPKQEIAHRLELELALALYRSCILSFGKARKLAGVSKWAFHELLGKNKVERHYGQSEFETDLKYAKTK